MSDQRRDAAKQTAAQAGAEGSAVQGVPSEEVGGGPGLDPPGALPDEGTDPRDEAYAHRPGAESAPKDGREPVGQSDYSDAAAIQRPPADS